jgi:hypothetical protein
LTNPRGLSYYGGMITKPELHQRAARDIMAVRVGSPEYQMIRRARIALAIPYRRTRKLKKA